MFNLVTGLMQIGAELARDLRGRKSLSIPVRGKASRALFTRRLVEGIRILGSMFCALWT